MVGGGTREHRDSLLAAPYLRQYSAFGEQGNTFGLWAAISNSRSAGEANAKEAPY
jgi:hypothetical protein